jgi:DUF4097 and DUF4098 domain-containing protein YvlB
MKIFKLFLTLFAAVSMSAGTTLQAQSAEGKEQLVVPLSEPGKPYKLTIGLVSGSIKVQTYEGKDIIIDAVAEENKKKESPASNGMKRISAGNGLDISAEEKNNRVTVHSNSWKGNLTLTIKVPQAEATMKLSTVNIGEIVVSNVSGELEVSNTNGPITLTNVAGSVVANTVNGKVTANFRSIDPKAAMAFSTLNGSVDVTFPSTLKANVKLKSDMGEMFTDFDLEADKSQPKVNKTNQNGMYRLNIENWVYGKINGGGPELMMKTMNGNIYIRKGK